MEEKTERLQKFRKWVDSEFTVKTQHIDGYNIDLYNTTIADNANSINDIITTIKLTYEYIVGDSNINNEVCKSIISMKIEREEIIKKLKYSLFHDIKVKGIFKKLKMMYDIICNINKLKIECMILDEQIETLKIKISDGDIE